MEDSPARICTRTGKLSSTTNAADSPRVGRLPASPALCTGEKPSGVQATISLFMLHFPRQYRLPRSYQHTSPHGKYIRSVANVYTHKDNIHQFDPTSVRASDIERARVTPTSGRESSMNGYLPTSDGVDDSSSRHTDTNLLTFVKSDRDGRRDPGALPAGDADFPVSLESRRWSQQARLWAPRLTIDTTTLSGGISAHQPVC